MAGYTIELYKYITSEVSLLEGSNTDNKNRNTYITFGDFDRMAISKTSAFSRMRDVSEISRRWIGDRQTILLYELREYNNVIYLEDGDQGEGFYLTDQKGGYKKVKNY